MAVFLPLVPLPTTFPLLGSCASSWTTGVTAQRVNCDIALEEQILNTSARQTIRSTGVDRSGHGDRRLARDKEMQPENKVTRGGVGEGRGKMSSATQPGSYWLGESFFGGLGGAEVSGGGEEEVLGLGKPK